MSTIDDAIQRVIKTGKPGFILCKNQSNQESVRVMAFHAKNKLGKKGWKDEKDYIGITKIESSDGSLFVKVYKKITTELYILDEETGKIIPIKTTIEDDKDWLRQLELMQKDGLNEEEIQKIKANWKKEEKEELSNEEELVEFAEDKDKELNADKLHRLEEKKAMMDLGED